MEFLDDRTLNILTEIQSGSRHFSQVDRSRQKAATKNIGTNYIFDVSEITISLTKTALDYKLHGLKALSELTENDPVADPLLF